MPRLVLLVLLLAGCASGEDPARALAAAVDSVWFRHTAAGDDAGAVRRLAALAEADNPLAMRALAFHYVDGRGVGRDDDEATRWYRRAAALGDSVAAARVAAYDAHRRPPAE